MQLLVITDSLSSIQLQHLRSDMLHRAGIAKVRLVVEWLASVLGNESSSAASEAPPKLLLFAHHRCSRLRCNMTYSWTLLSIFRALLVRLRLGQLLCCNLMTP